MKKLIQLKPDKRTVYLNGGKGQEATFLNISTDLTKGALEKDVKAGAELFRECMEFAEKRAPRVIVIDCNNEEEGLMAVSYLAGIYNQQECVGKDYWEEQDFFEEHDEMDLNDFNYLEEVTLDNMSDASTDDWEDSFDEDVWVENPYQLPVVKLDELIRYINMEAESIFENNHFTAGNRHPRNTEPYWCSVRREPVCVVVNQNEPFGGFLGYGFQSNESGIVSALRRFRGNRHVYVVRVGTEHPLVGLGAPEALEEEAMSYDQQVICELVLEYTAGVVKVACDMEAKKKYHQLLFENWAAAMGKKLERGFPKEKVVAQIIAMRNPDKSALIEKVYRYVLSQEQVGEVLTKEHFAILKKFRVLGAGAVTEEKVKSIRKLETELVGLDNVKRQVHSIVDVMKYNKKRQLMGLGNSGYHNVHLLIGAPGTAKTTVAQMLGNIMCEQRLLPGNRFISINGADLKGMYVGHSAPKTKRYFDEYDIILIDEAYSLTSEHDMDSFSQEAIAQLIIELEKHGMDKLVMFAGYGGMHVKEKDNKMKQFLDANPGIRSRINSTIYFESYTPEEMVDIVHCQAKNQKYQLSHQADSQMLEYFAERVKAADFGNGREARSLLENITLQAAARTMQLPENKLTKKLLQELKPEDVWAALKQQRENLKAQTGQKGKKCGFKQEE